ncbi:nucleoside-diphosphate kinase [Chitinispirillales bacterium ANBcel5]|uniref:nucleoside-diphosphate kinase n=1 Tax=Cellulosispirillum alkaliphilum TaxID=3039283 RepID=UPI002A54B5F4|nr:nucleoside-diphosphate kinase [Chitinispirillales bacterium ANBcel5]
MSGEERTLAIIKPDVVGRELAGKIITRIEESGFEIVGMKMLKLSEKLAGEFYAVHKGKPFYEELVDFMTSDRCIVMVLQAQGAILKWRELIGATNFEKAKEGTIRKEFATSVQRNACHGSDAPETARQEISFFFSGSELICC